MAKANETPVGLLSHAREFLAAANLVLNQNQQVSLPAYFLLGRSIELSLKAFLLASGLHRDELRSHKFGHDLELLFDKAIILGLENVVLINPLEAGVLRMLNYDYSTKRFEYRDTGATYHLPLIEVTVSVAQKLSNQLNQFCSQVNEGAQT